MQQEVLEDNSNKNKRIAKNTLMLYFRMLLVMGVSLYTTRIILNTLGVVDFGIYNVIGGIVAMFAVLNGTLTAGTQRFLTFELGKNNFHQLKKTFSVALLIHIFLAAIIFILAETIGLWFLNNKMNISIERMYAAQWVFQFSVFASLVSIIQAPYNAMILAYERMNVYAYISIVEVSLKLLVVYLLLISDYDKLIIYSILIFSVNMIIMFVYRTYTVRKYIESRFHFVWDKHLLKSMLTFSGWNIFGTLSSTAANQGVNILLNLFFGPVINAARGISFQVSMAIYGFVHNFQTAVNPQIIKLYANDNFKELNKLLYQNSKYAFLMLFLIAMPVMYEANIILSIWLKIVPENTALFCRLILIQCLIDSLINPLVMAVHSTGKMKIINLTAGTILLMTVPISYLLLKLGAPAYAPLVIYILLTFIHLFVEIYFLRIWIKLSFRSFLEETLYPILKILVLSIIFPLAIFNIMEEGLIRFLLVSSISSISIITSSYFLAIDGATRISLINYTKTKLNKK